MVLKNEMSLGEARSAMQGTRMGLEVNLSKKEEESTQKLNEDAVRFIQSSFTYKECVCYVADEEEAERNNVEVCCCGEPRAIHPGNISKNTEKWDEDLIETYSGSNAFGTIIFRDDYAAARKPSKFIRVGCRVQMKSYDGQNGSSKEKIDNDWEIKETVDNLLHYFKDYWQLFDPPPGIAVAIIGGAKQLKLDTKRVETFTRGLTKVGTSTNAWIFSGGCNYGIMKIVGDVVREARTMVGDNGGQSSSNALNTGLRCIGVNLWGYIKDHDNLVVKTRGWNRRPVTSHGQRSHSSAVSVSLAKQQPGGVIPSNYLTRAFQEPVRMYTSTKLARKTAYLNPDHSHFVLVDNGLRHHKCIQDSHFMMWLLHRLNASDVFIDDPLPDGRKPGDYSVPSVVIVIEGGQSVIDTVHFCVNHKIPVVICSHTGRAADILTAAVESILEIRGYTADPHASVSIPDEEDSYYKAIYDKVIEAFYNNRKNEEAHTFTRRAFEAAVNTELITIFDLTEQDDFDSAILSALLKVDYENKDEKARGEDAKEQLELALTWDRSDIAEEKILPHYPNDADGASNLNNVMKKALIQMKFGFVKLLINRGFLMNEFLTTDVLSELYDSALDKSSVWKKTFISGLFQDFKRMLSPTKRKLTDETDCPNMNLYWCFLEDLMLFYEKPSIENDRRIAHPYRELFLWSVLLNRVEMGMYFWQKIDHPIIAALSAALLSKACADRASAEDAEYAESYNNSKAIYEKLATDLISNCALVDRHLAVVALERTHPPWRSSTCLQTAALGDCKKFVGSSVCQDVLNHRWQRKIVSSWPFICLGILLVPFIPIIVQFDLGDSFTVDAISRKLSRLFDIYRFSSQVDDITIAADKLADKKMRRKGYAYLLRHTARKYSRFFKAPVTKFCFTTMTTLIFLTLYTFFLLFAYHDNSLSYQPYIEYLIHVWVFTLQLEVFYEIFNYPLQLMRFAFWWKSIWNKAELFAIILHLIGFAFRLWARAEPNDDVNFAAKVLFAFALFGFFMKLLRVLNASPSLGPQLVMIGNMLLEMVPFLILVLLLLVAFGVAHVGCYYAEALPVTYANIKYILTYSFWPLVNGPEIDEITEMDMLEGEKYKASMCSAENVCDANENVLTAILSNTTTPLSYSSNVSTTETLNTTLSSLFNNSNYTDLLLLPENSSAVKSSESDGPEPVAPSWFLSAYLAVWTLVSTLLANLLIAIFSNVYEEVNKNSYEIWKYYQYEMIREYENKQPLPPPLSVFGLLYKLVLYCCTMLASLCKRSWRKGSGVTVKVSSPNSATTVLASHGDGSDNDGNDGSFHEEQQADPALQFEHETRAAMIRNKTREELHGGLVNQLSEIHKHLATARQHVAVLDTLETMAERAIDDGENGHTFKRMPRDKGIASVTEPVFSAKRARSHASPAFLRRQSENLAFVRLESRLEQLNARVPEVQQLCEQLATAVKTRLSVMSKSKTSNVNSDSPSEVNILPQNLAAEPICDVSTDISASRTADRPPVGRRMKRSYKKKLAPKPENITSNADVGTTADVASPHREDVFSPPENALLNESTKAVTLEEGNLKRGEHANDTNASYSDRRPLSAWGKTKKRVERSQPGGVTGTKSESPAVASTLADVISRVREKVAPTVDSVQSEYANTQQERSKTASAVAFENVISETADLVTNAKPPKNPSKNATAQSVQDSHPRSQQQSPDRQSKVNEELPAQGIPQSGLLESILSPRSSSGHGAEVRRRTTGSTSENYPGHQVLNQFPQVAERNVRQGLSSNTEPAPSSAVDTHDPSKLFIPSTRYTRYNKQRELLLPVAGVGLASVPTPFHARLSFSTRNVEKSDAVAEWLQNNNEKPQNSSK